MTRDGVATGPRAGPLPLHTPASLARFSQQIGRANDLPASHPCPAGRLARRRCRGRRQARRGAAGARDGRGPRARHRLVRHREPVQRQRPPRDRAGDGRVGWHDGRNRVAARLRQFGAARRAGAPTADGHRVLHRRLQQPLSHRRHLCGHVSSNELPAVVGRRRPRGPPFLPDWRPNTVLRHRSPLVE